ncbi:MAG: hypothetical protein ACRDZR_17005, partial [Acidimicrobiales bacterium]
SYTTPPELTPALRCSLQTWRSCPGWRNSYRASTLGASSSSRQPCCAGTGIWSPRDGTYPHGRPGRPGIAKGTTALVLVGTDVVDRNASDARVRELHAVANQVDAATASALRRFFGKYLGQAADAENPADQPDGR